MSHKLYQENKLRIPPLFRNKLLACAKYLNSIPQYSSWKKLKVTVNRLYAYYLKRVENHSFVLARNLLVAKAILSDSRGIPSLPTPNEDTFKDLFSFRRRRSSHAKLNYYKFSLKCDIRCKVSRHKF